MAHLRRTETFEISGRTFKCKALSFEDARKAYAVVYRAIINLDEDAAAEGAVLIACLTGHLSEADVATLCTLFAKDCVVDFNDASEGQTSRILPLSRPEVQDEVFEGALEDMYEWLGYQVNFNFAGALGKMSAALKSLVEKQKAAMAKAKAEAEKSKSQTST